MFSLIFAHVLTFSFKHFLRFHTDLTHFWPIPTHSSHSRFLLFQSMPFWPMLVHLIRCHCVGLDSVCFPLRSCFETVGTVLLFSLRVAQFLDLSCFFVFSLFVWYVWTVLFVFVYGFSCLSFSGLALFFAVRLFWKLFGLCFCFSRLVGVLDLCHLLFICASIFYCDAMTFFFSSLFDIFCFIVVNLSHRHRLLARLLLHSRSRKDHQSNTLKTVTCVV